MLTSGECNTSLPSGTTSSPDRGDGSRIAGSRSPEAESISDGRGAFIVLEGPEGSGKSTQTRMLAERLSEAGWNVLATREPGGTSLGERLRTILFGGEDYAILPAAEALLYAAARAQHVGEVLIPALAAGMVVVSDRFVDSSIAYQAGGMGLPEAEVRAAQELATGGLAPDLKLLLDVPVGVGLERRLAIEDSVNRIDRAEVAFHERVRATYLRLVSDDSSRWVVIDASRPVDVVAYDVWSLVRSRLEPESTPDLADDAAGGAR